MGLIKEYASRGYGFSDTVVCHGCATDYALQNFIKENGHLATCDYCGSRRKCIDLEELMEPIMNGIRFEYTDAANELAYEGREGGYQGTVYDSDELIKDVLYKELGIEDDRLLDDISSLMDDVAWCERDYYWGREEDNAYYTWEDFCTLVKTKVRYVFYKVSDDLLTGSEPQPSEILEIIGSYVRKSNLIKELNGKTTKLYRARTHKDEGGLKGAHEYFPPLPKQTKPYRMNPEGIPMLYLTYKPETAVREVYSKKAKYASVARYKLLRNFRVVDFTKPTNVQFPSLFDDERRGRRAAMAFLRRFSEDISKPDARNKAVEYVPTQIVTEYFRHMFRDEDGNPVDGIIYNSAQDKGEKCLVLFVQREQIKNSDTCNENPIVEVKAYPLGRYENNPAKKAFQLIKWGS